MRLLLDTHAFILFTGNPTALPAVTRAALEDPGNELLLSVASPWEMQINADLGKLPLRASPCELVQFEIDRGAISLLPIALAHVEDLSRLPSIHRDPFDRILIAQARCETLRLVSGDHQIHAYPVDCLWD